MAYRVLITDDSPAMRTFVRRVIEVSGFELSACFEAGDGAVRLARIEVAEVAAPSASESAASSVKTATAKATWMLAGPP